jgi:hypothetical protein
VAVGHLYPDWLVTISTHLHVVQGQNTSVRDVASKGRIVQGMCGPRNTSSKDASLSKGRIIVRDFLFRDTSVGPWDTSSKGRSIRDFLSEDTSVGVTLSRHQEG